LRDRIAQHGVAGVAGASACLLMLAGLKRLPENGRCEILRS